MYKFTYIYKYTHIYTYICFKYIYIPVDPMALPALISLGDALKAVASPSQSALSPKVPRVHRIHRR
jgi:hypothetical protein